MLLLLLMDKSVQFVNAGLLCAQGPVGLRRFVIEL